MLRIFIALGKHMPKNKAMVEDTKRVAQLMAKYNCTMVQGGARLGLMGVAVDEFQKYSEEVVMIVPEAHKSDIEGTTNKEFYIVEGESDRMRITINTCDMMVVLPGGSGTLAELAYYNETCKSGEHSAKIVVVNTKGYYNKLLKFMSHQVKTGLMDNDARKFEVINSADQLEAILQEMIKEKQAKLHALEVARQKEEAKRAREEAKLEKEQAKKKADAPKAKEVKAKTTVKPAGKTTKKVAVKLDDVKAEPEKVEPKKVEKPSTKAAAKTKKPATKTVAKKTEKPAEKASKPEVKKAPANKAEVKKEAKAEPKKEAKASTKKVEKPVAKKPATKAPAKKAEAKPATKTVAKKAEQPATKKPVAKKTTAKKTTKK